MTSDSDWRIFVELQEQLCKANTWQKAQPTTDVVSLLSEIRIGTGKMDCWTGTKTANIPAVMASAAAASGGNLKLLEAFNIDVLSTAIVSATVKCNHAGEIAGMTRLYENMESADDDSEVGTSAPGPGGLSRLISGSSRQPTPTKKQSFNELLLNKFVRLLQKFVSTAEKGGNIDKPSFRETCSQATALLLSNLVNSKLRIGHFGLWFIPNGSNGCNNFSAKRESYQVYRTGLKSPKLYL